MARLCLGRGHWRAGCRPGAISIAKSPPVRDALHATGDMRIKMTTSFSGDSARLVIGACLGQQNKQYDRLAWALRLDSLGRAQYGSQAGGDCEQRQVRKGLE